MDLSKKVIKNKRILIGLVCFLLLISIGQSVFIVKLHRSSNQDKTENKVSKEFEKYFSLEDDFFKPFNNQDWNPFEEFQSMRERMDRMFDDSYNRFKLSPFFDKNKEKKNKILPQTDLSDEGDKYVVKMNIPGSEKTEIEANIEGDLLTVKAKILAEKGNKYLQMERSTGFFQRSIPLPEPVDNDAMETSYEDGVLTITLPKQK